METQDPHQKKWLEPRSIRLEYVLGLLLALLGILWQRDKDLTRVDQSVSQRPELVERRNREMDKLEACMNRQIDLLRHCKN